MKDVLSKYRDEGAFNVLRVFALSCAEEIENETPELTKSKLLVKGLLRGRVGIADLLTFQDQMEEDSENLTFYDDEKLRLFNLAYSLCSPSSHAAANGVYEAIYGESVDCIGVEGRSLKSNGKAVSDQLEAFLFLLSQIYVGPLNALLPISSRSASAAAEHWLASKNNTRFTVGEVKRHFEIGPCYTPGYIERELCWAIRLEEAVPNVLRSSRFIVIGGVSSEFMGMSEGYDEG